MNNNLIFDLGFHVGVDSKNYLEKGYNVVAVEANPNLVARAFTYFAEEINDKKLTMLHNVIVSTDYSGSYIEFFVNNTHTDWSSCNQKIAEQNNETSEIMQVPVITLHNLVETYGIPYYMKVDVEGMDIAVAKQLSELKEKPLYVSFELNKNDFADIFTYLHMAGYKEFQLVNQANNKPYSSGNFGHFLPNNIWKSYADTLSDYVKYRELKFIDNKNLALGWIDIHAKR